ncbi:MAG: hypothetical protein ACJ76F_07020, partial [Bacteroidia bacterium]
MNRVICSAVITAFLFSSCGESKNTGKETGKQDSVTNSSDTVKQLPESGIKDCTNDSLDELA